MEPITTDVSSDEISDYIRIIRLEQDDKSIIRELIAKQKQTSESKLFRNSKNRYKIMRIKKNLRKVMVIDWISWKRDF